MNLVDMIGSDNTVVNDSLRVLAIHRYYWPDTPPYASLLRRIVSTWVSDGHSVEVLTSQPSYKAAVDNQRLPAKDILDGAKITRMKLPNESGKSLIRVWNAIRLSLTILRKALFGRRYDVIMVSTAPPVLAGFTCALVAKFRKTRFIYHCMDIHPEIGRLSGEFRNPVVFKVLQAMDRWSCSKANPVVVLSDDMKTALEERRGSCGYQIQVINNFSLPSEDAPTSSLPFDMHDKDFNLLFAGNIGRFQGLDVLIEAMGLLVTQHPRIRLIMMGEGTARKELEQKALELNANVEFVGHHSVSVAKLAMQKADAGFVSLVPGIIKYAYPSKTMTYLEQGCPLLVAVESQSNLAQDVERNGVGLAVPSGDVGGLKDAIIKMAQDEAKLRDMKERALMLGSSDYSEANVLPVWSDLLRELGIE